MKAQASASSRVLDQYRKVTRADRAAVGVGPLRVPHGPAQGEGNPSSDADGTVFGTHKVYDDVMSDIRSGALAVDDRLPNELEMAEQYGVSRDVIRRAKEELAGQGWLIVLQGRGTFVAHPTPGDSH